MPDLHTASWACVMERNQPSRSSRQARSTASLFGPLPPNTTYLSRLPTHPHRTDGHVQRIRTPVQQNSYTAQPTWCSEQPFLDNSSTTTVHTWQRLDGSFLVGLLDDCLLQQ